MVFDTIAKDPPYVNTDLAGIRILPLSYGPAHPSQINGVLDDLFVQRCEFGVEERDGPREFGEEGDFAELIHEEVEVGVFGFGDGGDLGCEGWESAGVEFEDFGFFG